MAPPQRHFSKAEEPHNLAQTKTGPTVGPESLGKDTSCRARLINALKLHTHPAILQTSLGLSREFGIATGISELIRSLVEAEICPT